METSNHHGRRPALERKLVPVTLQLPPEHVDRLRRLAARRQTAASYGERVTHTTLIREAIASFLQANEAIDPRQKGLPLSPEELGGVAKRVGSKKGSKVRAAAKATSGTQVPLLSKRFPVHKGKAKR